MYKVLLVDDTISTHAYTNFIITRQSDNQFEMEAVVSAEEFLEKVEEKAPDIVLLDINLPRMNGLEACKIFRDRGFETPVVVVTAELNIEHLVRETRAAGADDFITKPYNAEVLIARMLHVLEHDNMTPDQRDIFEKDKAKRNEIRARIQLEMDEMRGKIKDE